MARFVGLLVRLYLSPLPNLPSPVQAMITWLFVVGDRTGLGQQLAPRAADMWSGMRAPVFME